jgi:ubiquitin carboxyl-terminal hydrolase 7
LVIAKSCIVQTNLVLTTKLFYRSILLFPKGNNQKKSTSVYLQINNPKENGVEEGWHVCAQFGLAISNPNDPTLYYHNSNA